MAPPNLMPYIPENPSKGALTSAECHRRLCRDMPQLRYADKYKDIATDLAADINVSSFLAATTNSRIFSSMSYTSIRTISKFLAVTSIVKAQNEILKDFNLTMQFIPITRKHKEPSEFFKIKKDLDDRIADILRCINRCIENQEPKCDRLDTLIETASFPSIATYVGKEEDITVHLDEPVQEYVDTPVYLINGGNYANIISALKRNYFSNSTSIDSRDLNIDTFMAQLHQVLPLFITDYSEVKDLYG